MQNDFLRPFVVVMRHSRAVEIRELIIRCVSQMVLARVANVKSGWKSMFMVRLGWVGGRSDCVWFVLDACGHIGSGLGVILLPLTVRAETLRSECMFSCSL